MVNFLVRMLVLSSLLCLMATHASRLVIILIFNYWLVTQTIIYRLAGYEEYCHMPGHTDFPQGTS